MNLIKSLYGGLVVSCQPVPGGPFDRIDAILSFARAAQVSGAVALRIEGISNVAAVTKACQLPVIGITKRDLDTSAVRITPFIEDVEELIRSGAAIVAVDATDRPRPVASKDLIAAIKGLGAIAMADISTEAEARSALDAGADIIGTTMSGYTEPGPSPVAPDLDLVRNCAALRVPVLAEGRYNSPSLAAAAIRAGATAVVVGSAITRTEHVIGWFRAAIEAERRASKPILAFDVGGTKSLATLVRGSEIIDRKIMATRRDVGAPGWIEDLASLATAWRGEYSGAVAAVTGLVNKTSWSSLNPGTLSIPNDYPLAEKLGAALGVPLQVINDAQAAAWGEYRFGAGRGRDMAFVTVSSGIGGGLVVGGRLLRGARGLAGSLGQTLRGKGDGLLRLEALASGFGIAEAARVAGHPGDAKSVIAAANDHVPWANDILAGVASELAAALVGVQAMVDPDCIVIGGGVGLAHGFIARLERAFETLPEALVPILVPAKLGVEAGVIGAADLLNEYY